MTYDFPPRLKDRYKEGAGKLFQVQIKACVDSDFTRLSSLSTFYRELKRTHALVDKSRLMPMLWSVN